MVQNPMSSELPHSGRVTAFGSPALVGNDQVEKGKNAKSRNPNVN
jgi:hypothetical protein